MEIILLDEWEAKGKTRVEQAEELILGLPIDCPGRSTWLFQFGKSEEAVMLRATNNPSVDFNNMWENCGTESLNIPALPPDKVKRIMEIINEDTKDKGLVS